MVNSENLGIPARDGSGTVRIKTPYHIEGTRLRIFRRPNVTVQLSGKQVWSGELGELARFSVDEPAEIQIDLGPDASPVTAPVEPNCSYELVCSCTQGEGLPEYVLTRI